MDIMDDVLDLMDSLGETLEKGKRGAKRVLRGEGGFSTLVMVLVILALGAIIITPLLVFVITGQRAGRTHNEVTDRLYAADTGIQDGMWRVQNDELPSDMLGTWDAVPCTTSVYTYMLPNQVNDKDVSVTLRAVWLLEGLESAKNGRQPHGELVTVGNVMRAGEYKIVIMDNGIDGQLQAGEDRRLASGRVHVHSRFQQPGEACHHRSGVHCSRQYLTGRMATRSSGTTMLRPRRQSTTLICLRRPPPGG